MSKFVKDLLTQDLRRRLTGVNDALLVNVVGLNSVKTARLRGELRKKNIQLQVVKNSMARRAAEGTPLAPALDGVTGTLALVWGCEDVVTLSKEIVKLTELKELAGFEARGGAIDGAKISAADVKAVSAWPSRGEQLSLLVGQILSPGAKLASQLNGIGGALVSQIKQRVEDLEKAEGAPADAGSAEASSAEGGPAEAGSAEAAPAG